MNNIIQVRVKAEILISIISGDVNIVSLITMVVNKILWTGQKQKID